MAWYRDFYPPASPREAKGGIKAQSKRGGFAQSWWAQRWIAVIESFNLGARLTRGRAYARKGQVTSIEIAKGKIVAKVQGTRATPYSIKISVKTLAGDEWDRVAEALAKEAAFGAALLSGQMPEDIESVFKKAKASLFPSKRGDLQTECSCPDWSNPCKHIAAVYYLIGEEFDRDPFLIFKLRGMPRDELLKRLEALRAKDLDEPMLDPDDTALSLDAEEPLSSDQALFWGDQCLVLSVGEVAVPSLTAAILRRLGGFPFWQGKIELVAALEPVYRDAVSIGAEVLIGGKDEV